MLIEEHPRQAAGLRAARFIRSAQSPFRFQVRIRLVNRLEANAMPLAPDGQKGAAAAFPREE